MIRIISYLVSFLFVSLFILGLLQHLQRSNQETETNMITKREEESTMKQGVAPTSISVLAGILLPPRSTQPRHRQPAVKKPRRGAGGRGRGGG